MDRFNEAKKFYHNGLRFQCQECGMCCRLPQGYVEISEEEALILANYLALDSERFLKQYCHADNGQIRLQEKEDKSCIFLEENRCSVYEVRPLQCQTFPFWPENLKSHYRWKTLKIFCPGIDQGRMYNREEIQAIKARVKTPAPARKRSKG